MEEKVYRVLFRVFMAHVLELERLQSLEEKKAYCRRIIDLILTKEEKGDDDAEEILSMFHAELVIKLKGLNKYEAMACRLFGPRWLGETRPL